MGFEANPSATGSSEGGRLRRSHDGCWGGGGEIPTSPPYFEVNLPSRRKAKNVHTNCGREPYDMEFRSFVIKN